jgi:PKD repeat protein
MTIAAKVYRELKKQGSMTLAMFYASIPDEKSYEIKKVLDEQVEKKFLAVENGVYRIRFHLESWTSKTDVPVTTARKYEDILAAKAGMSGSAIIATAAPPSFRNPNLNDVVHRGQGNTGTCLSSSTRVLMEDLTYLPISHIRNGDYVITHRGEKKRVTEVMRREWQGNSFKMWVYGFDRFIEGTFEHPIFTKDGWKQLGTITNDDFVAIPKVILVSDKTLYEREKDPEFLWLLGLYLAEGSLDTHRVRLTLGISEKDVAQRVADVMAKYNTENAAVSTKVSIREVPDHNVIRVDIHGARWVDVFRDLGGDHCDAKAINTRLMFLDPELQMNIYTGWVDGDGHDHARGYVVTVSTSETLIRQMQQILMRNGIRGNITKRSEREDRLEAWELYVHKEHRYGYFEGDYYWVHPRKIEVVSQYMGGNVYNLEVEDDHTYVVESVAVHNCVGQATAYAADLNYIQLTGDRPTAADWAKVKFNVRLDPNNPNSTTYYDVLLPKTMAAAFPYWRSRIRCNVTVPSGSYVSCAMPTWRDEGICLNDQWLLSKDGRTAWRDPYPDAHPVTGEKAYDFAKKHKIDGYASVVTATGIREAIAKYGFVVGAIVVYENFTQMDPNTGIFPDPKGATVGGHALCFIGYDANYLYCLHSWRDELPAKVGGISWSYFSIGGVEFFTALDASENKIVLDPTPVAPVAKFTADKTSGEAPLTVAFTDTSTGDVKTRTWDFGDGNTAVGTQVSHTYATPGSYLATLTVRNDGGASSASAQITVTAPPPPPAPVAKIEATPVAGQVPLSVQFYDRSEGTVEQRAWTFGDGSPASTEIAPKRTYQTAGTYTAVLNVSNATGASSASVGITATAAPTPPTPPTPWEKFIKWLIDFINGLFNR